jgi:hypothetical protein
MKKTDRFATIIWRFIVGIIGLSVAALMFYAQTEELTLFQIVATGGLLVLFFGYALGFDKQMQDFFLGLGKNIK